MYQQGQRFSKPVTDFNMDPLDDNKMVHIERIDQRVAGGMTIDDAIRSYASQLAIKPNELAELYYKHKSKINIT